MDSSGKMLTHHKLYADPASGTHQLWPVLHQENIKISWANGMGWLGSGRGAAVAGRGIQPEKASGAGSGFDQAGCSGVGKVRASVGIGDDQADAGVQVGYAAMKLHAVMGQAHHTVYQMAAAFPFNGNMLGR